MSLAGLLIFRGTGPPPSRKFWETPVLPPLLVELSMPLKYCRRFTSVPLYFCPTARIPGTAKEESVSKSCSVPLPFGGLQGRRRTIHVWRGLVANDGGVDEQSQQLVLVLGGVVLEERRRVWVGSCQRRCTDGRARRIHTVVADGRVHGSLGHGSADGSEESCKLEKHVDDGLIGPWIEQRHVSSKSTHQVERTTIYSQLGQAWIPLWDGVACSRHGKSLNTLYSRREQVKRMSLGPLSSMIGLFLGLALIGGSALPSILSRITPHQQLLVKHLV